MSVSASYVRGYRAGHVAARRGSSTRLGWPRSAGTDLGEYERGYEAGVNAVLAPRPRRAWTPSYRRGYLAGRALARRGVQAKRATGRPRHRDSDPREYEAGYAAGLNATVRATQPRCSMGCGVVVLDPGPCGFCVEQHASAPVSAASVGPVLLAAIRADELVREPTDLLAFARDVLAGTPHRDEHSPAVLTFGDARQPIVGQDGQPLLHGDVAGLIGRELAARVQTPARAA